MMLVDSMIRRDEQSFDNRYFWWLLSGVWFILALIMADQLVLRSAGTEREVSWYNAVMLEGLYCAQWLALAPIVLTLARAFPLKSKKFIPGIVVHLLAGAAMSAITMAGRTILNWVFLEHFQASLTWERVSGNMTEALDYGVMSYLLNMLFSYSLLFYGEVRLREIKALQLEKELSEAQLTALKMQLHPHFFFNTLNVISVLIRKHENELAVDMISRLSKFLRYTLDKTEAQEVPLREELHAIDLYLEIQNVRFREQLSLRRAIAPDVLDARVPTLILQPLVENALDHGIAKREQGGELFLSAERVNGSVQICVRDNGPGYVAPTTSLNTQQGAPAGKGIGLKNSESRLKKLYGSDYTFEITSQPEGGTMVRLGIPYRTAEE